MRRVLLLSVASDIGALLRKRGGPSQLEAEQGCYSHGAVLRIVAVIDGPRGCRKHHMLSQIRWGKIRKTINVFL